MWAFSFTGVNATAADSAKQRRQSNIFSLSSLFSLISSDAIFTSFLFKSFPDNFDISEALDKQSFLFPFEDASISQKR